MNTMTVITVCPFCGHVTPIDVDMDGYLNWTIEGVSIQKALPNLTAEDREMLKTGICPTCWEKMFGCDEVM